MADNERKTYRIRTTVGSEAPASINVSLQQTYENIDVLSLEIKQDNFYKMPAAGYGVIIGRVLANDGFGIPNAKISVFIPYEGLEVKENTLYNYTSTASRNQDGVRYNLLPRNLDEDCHQNVGTMFEKEYLLDNNDVIEVFEKYYKYTTVTNQAGDYFIYGVPTGTQTLHVDLDLSDIGVLSQRPRDMIYKGYNLNQFESPNKFKKSTNLNSLAQIHSQDRTIQVYPFWGDTTDDETNGTITRCDINIDYKFEPTCVFMGSIVSDTGGRDISHKCVPDDEIGKMSELIAGEGTIEMIRKTFDGKVEQLSIKSNKLIDGDGVWCYQIPMNLDYVMTDEFGNMVPTDNPNKGIPTRARVRFRIGMDEALTDDVATKRARFLVPNNPRLTSDYPDFSKTHKADYEFGTFTKDESYRDMFWNKVYTVKSYIPRLQKARALRRRVHTGIKNVNHPGGHNPFPFNSLFMRLTFTYSFLCLLMKVFCYVVYGVNKVISAIGVLFYRLGRFFANQGWLGCWTRGVAKFFLEMVPGMYISLESFCDDGNLNDNIVIAPGITGNYQNIMNGIPLYSDDTTSAIHINACGDYLSYDFRPTGGNYTTDLKQLFNCIENELAQDQECTSFNFQNDWVNGVIYAPLWFRKIKSKKKIFFGLFTRRAKDKWCNGADSKMASKGNGLALCHTCAQRRTIVGNTLNKLDKTTDSEHATERNCYGYKCHKKAVSFIKVNNGLIIQKETMLGEEVYYYKSVEYDDNKDTGLYRFPVSSTGLSSTMGEVKLLFATDLVLLGSLNECDSDGVPQFFKGLESTTYNMPPDLMLLDYDVDDSKIKFKPNNSTSGGSLSGVYSFQNATEDISETGAIIQDSVHTNQTGADWGNYGYDQRTSTAGSADSGIFSFATENEDEDFGGLFYGLTCWTTYTKPKSCVNLSRICEYGVSLDESDDFYNFNSMGEIEDEDNDYVTVPPDGFVSYDELYNQDGRAMFATMNGNNLRTRINKENGFPVYDFFYLYPDNFDGSLRNLMRLGEDIPSPQNGNYNLEVNSDSYMRFRYGNTPRKEDYSVNYYSTKQKLTSLYPHPYEENYGRFPRFENSFYFYFGLNAGKTAIDKFRTQYYSECLSDDEEKSVIGLDFTPNSWCNNFFDEKLHQAVGDGWISIDATYVSAPYILKLENLSGHPEYNLSIEGVTEPKIYFACDTVSALEDDGFVRVISENGNPMLVNGYYRLLLIDSEGGEYRQMFNFVDEKITFDLSAMNFKYKNDVIAEQFTGDTYYRVATLGHEQAHPREYETGKPLGGTITVSNIMQGGTTADSFVIEIKPVNLNYITGISHTVIVDNATQQEYQRRVTSYEGSYLKVLCGNIIQENTHVNGYNTLMYGYSLEDGYSFTFGVPYGGISYRVTVTQWCSDCPKIDMARESYNVTTKNIRVFEPLDFKMFVNGIDYGTIKNFTHGWRTDSSLGPTLPYSGYSPTTNLDSNEVVGWTNIYNDGGLRYLPQATTSTQYSSIADVAAIVASEETNGCPYHWEGEYLFDASVFITEADKFTTVPETKQGNSDFIMVLDPNDGKYYYYVWNGSIYRPYIRNGVRVTSLYLSEYFDGNASVDVKNEIIDEINFIVEKRLEYLARIGEAFIVRDDNVSSLTVTYQTRETPVKTLIYYSPDFEEDTSFESEILDTSFSENSVPYITVPTISGTITNIEGNMVQYGANLDELGHSLFTMIGSEDGAMKYKKPFFVGIENEVGEYITEGMGGVENPDRSEMFGVHLIDKRIKFVYNSWNCINEWPYFYFNYNSGGSLSGVLHPFGTYISRNGLFAGYMLNGVPYEYDEYENNILGTHFRQQRLSYDFGVHTISQDSDHNALEDRIPTVRFIYDNHREQDSIYNGYQVTSQLPQIPNWQQFLLIENENDSLVVSDEVTSKEIYVSVEPKATTIEYTYEDISEEGDVFPCYVYKGTVSFNIGNGKYAFYKNTENPVYGTNTDTLLNFPNGYDMSFQHLLTSDFVDRNAIELYSVQTLTGTQISYVRHWYETDSDYVSTNENGTWTVYAVYVDNDYCTHAVTKTYDVTPMEVKVTNTETSHTLFINVGGTSGNNTLYPYLKHYTFTIDFYGKDSDGNTALVYTKDVVGGYDGMTILSGNGCQSNYIAFTNLDQEFNMSAYLDYTIYITDVTGLRHKAIKVSAVDFFCPFVKNN